MKVIVKTVLGVCFTCLLSACGNPAGNTEKQKIIVNIAQATTVPSDSRKEFSFISKPFRTSELSFRVSGPVDRFEVYPGNYYKRGDIIAEIDPRDFRVRKERAEGIYNQAKAEYERIKVLFEKNNVSASAYEKAKADYISAKTAFNTATNELEDTRLVAPFDGYIGEVFIEKHQDVRAAQRVISFVDIHQLKIETYITQYIAFSFQDLKKVDLRFDAMPDSVYEARVVEVSKSTTSNNLSYMLTALLPNQNRHLLSGMSGKIVIDTGNAVNEPDIVVPQISVCHNPQDGDYVWIVDKQAKQVSRRKVNLGELLPGGKIRINDGLEPGETVATSGLRFLSDDLEVELSVEKANRF